MIGGETGDGGTGAPVQLGVVGTGTIGAGLTVAAARAGMRVVVLSRSPEGADLARAEVESALAAGPPPPPPPLVTHDAAALGELPVVLEAVIEEAEAKAEAFAAIEAVTGPGTCLGTTTSSL